MSHTKTATILFEDVEFVIGPSGYEVTGGKEVSKQEFREIYHRYNILPHKEQVKFQVP